MGRVSFVNCHTICLSRFFFTFSIFIFLHKTNFLVDKFVLCKKQVKNVDNVDNFVNNSIFPSFLNPQNVDNYSHLSITFDISTNINCFVCAIYTIISLSINFQKKELSFLSANCQTIQSFPIINNYYE